MLVDFPEIFLMISMVFMSMADPHSAFERQGVGWQEHRKDGTWDWKIFGFYCFESGHGNISRKS